MTEIVRITEADIERDFRGSVRRALVARREGAVIECPWHFYYLHFATLAKVRDPGPGQSSAKKFPALARLIHG